jgi:hypothetical protein
MRNILVLIGSLNKFNFLSRVWEVGTVLWNENLGLAVLKVDVKKSTSDFDAVSWVEDIADSLSLWEASVRNISVNFTINIVGEGNEEISSGESVESIIRPFLSVCFVSYVVNLSCFHDLWGELIDIWGLV